MIHFAAETALQPIEATSLAGIRHGFFTRQGGVSTGIYAGLNCGLGSSDDKAAVHENRRRLAAHFGAESDVLLNACQIHSADVATVTEPWAPGEGPRLDALVTRRPGLVLAVATADCGPLLFADPEAGVIGAAHAGWKGAFTGVLENTALAMEALGADRRRIRVALGPTISRTAYEVGPEFRVRFAEAEADNARFFTPSPRSEHHIFDLPAYIGARAEAAGLAFETLDLCTYADETRFYSYRRATHRAEPDYGRLFAAITL